MTSARSVLLVLAAAGCLPHGGRYTQVETELPVGECATFRATAGGTCERIVRDRHATASVGLPLGEAEPSIGTAYQYRAFAIGLDWRRLRREMDPFKYDTLAAGAALYVGTLGSFDRLVRYVDVGPLIGGELGILKFGQTGWRGRADWFWGGFVDVHAPDLGPIAYLANGVPGLRIELRRTDFAREWSSATTLTIGLVWRWGREYELHTSGTH